MQTRDSHVNVTLHKMAEKTKAPRWMPLEANPDVMNKYVQGMGMKGNYQFFDVFGLDPELLAMVPQPAIALLLLFPITENNSAYTEQEDERIKKEGQIVSKDVYFMKQTVGNACGTVGLLHSLANNLDRIALDDGYLKTFFSKTASMTPEERADFLGKDEDITEAHETSAKEGDTVAPPPEQNVNLHFISIVHKDGHIYELDGRRPFPVNHGPTTADNFLQEAVKVCKDYMKRDPNEVNFNIIALSAAE